MIILKKDREILFDIFKSIQKQIHFLEKNKQFDNLQNKDNFLKYKYELKQYQYLQVFLNSQNNLKNYKFLCNEKTQLDLMKMFNKMVFLEARLHKLNSSNQHLKIIKKGLGEVIAEFMDFFSLDMEDVEQKNKKGNLRELAEKRLGGLKKNKN